MEATQQKARKKTVEQALILLLKDAEHKKDKLIKIQNAKYWCDAIGQKLLSSLTSEDIQNAIPTHVVHTGENTFPSNPKPLSFVHYAGKQSGKASWLD